MTEVAGSSPNHERDQFACSTFPLSARARSLVPTVEDELKSIGSQRRLENRPVFEMLSSLVTIALPQSARDFNHGKLAKAFNPTTQGPPLGDMRLRAAIAEQRQSNFNSPITAENVFIASGARTALHAVLAMTMDSEAGLILMPPHFGRFMGISRLSSVVSQFVPLDRSKNFQPDIEAVEQEWNPMTRAILVANPNNPTGTVMETENLVRLREIAAKNRGYLIVDETFEAFDFSQQRKTATHALNIENTVVIGSFSEKYSIPDHRIGYVIANKDIVRVASEVTKNVSFGTPMHVQELVIELLKGKQDHLEQVVPIIKLRQSAMREALLANPAIEQVYGEAGTFVWVVPARHHQIDCRETSFAIARQHGILMMPGFEYGAPGCFRIGLGQISSPQEFARACDILSSYDKWRKHTDPIQVAEIDQAESEWGALKHPQRASWVPPPRMKGSTPLPPV